MKRLTVLLALSLLCGAAHAQTFTVTPSTGSGPRTATWNVPNGMNCQAGGDWTGAKAASGTQPLTGLAVGTRTFTLACTVPGVPTKGSAKLTWVAPTQNVDNTPLTNLAGFKILSGRSSPPSANTITLSNPALQAHTIDSLDAGTWFFGIKAFNAAGTESDLSGIVSKTVADTPTTTAWSATTTTDVTLAKPKAPVLSAE